MDKEKKFTARRPVVLKKLNADNLQLIERGLLGDLPDRFKPYQGPVRADSNDLVVAKPSGFLSSCLPVIPDSPCSEKFPDDEPLSVSPLKKSFSFRGFSRISFLGKKEKPKWKTIVEDERHIDEASIDEDTRRKENEKSRRRWFFKNKEEERRVGRRPIYSRSKSFEFLPKALEEDPAESVSEHRKLAKNASFVFGSTDSLADVWPSNGPDSPSDVYYDTEDCIFLKSVKEISPESSKYNSSVSTISSNPSGIANSILNRESFQNLLDEFNRTVEIFSENYSSDCEPYTKPNSGDVKFRDRKKSSSFSTLPSPKVVQNKVSEVSEDFKLELSRMLSKKRATAVPDLRSPRRGSVTDWFVLEDPAATGKTNAASEANKYKRAQGKPQNRVRRMSSTKYWITPEECAVYSREQRPPLVIPRITQYRTPKRQQTHHTQHYVEEPPEPVLKPPIRNYDWSPGSDRARDHDRTFSKNDSPPPFSRINKRLGGSTENLLGRRPNHLQLAASSSGDSLDVEIRDRKPGYARNSKSRSMVAPKQVARSPVPAPRYVLPSHHEMTVLLEGPVKRTKFCESGKKCRKNWIDCYMVLTPTDLIFYKKPPSVPPSPGSMNPELILSLKNAHVVKCIPNHTKSFTRSLLLTVGYDQYLIQDETEDRAMRWMKGIVSVSYKLGPPKVDDFPRQYQSSNTDIESLGRTPPVARHNNRSNPKAGGSSNEDLSDSTEGSIPKAKRTLRSFFPKRPTKDFLIKKGIYKEEPVFGRKLEEVCPATSPRVPEFVVNCIKEIERSEENMTTDGLYRASGNLSQVQKIRLEVDQNKLNALTDENTDIHVLTGSLKLFFRELKEPLIPCAVFDRVLAACSIKPREAKIKEFRDIVNSLPQCNRDTLKFLLEHLLRVTQYSERNRMHTANLAIVFGPTLLWAPAEQAHNIAIDCIQQNHVVEILLNEFKDIFVENGKAKKKS